MLNNQNKNLVLIQDLGMLYPKETSKKKYRYGIYKCYCGTEFESRTQHIKSGAIKSCGCYNKQVVKERFSTHGLTKHRLYSTWSNMLKRCNNENYIRYKDHGGRGIKVCDEWLDINKFIEDMYPTFKEGLTLDRIDNNLGYSKENCRWTTHSVQNSNTRVLKITNTSGYRGISWHIKANKWSAGIKINNKRKYLGLFDSKIEAAQAYDNYIIANNLYHTRNFS